MALVGAAIGALKGLPPDEITIAELLKSKGSANIAAQHPDVLADLTREQLAALPLRSPLGIAGSIAAFVAIIAAIVCTAWVSESRVTAESAIAYLLALSAAYGLKKLVANNSKQHTANSK